MPRLPHVSGREAARAFEKDGFTIERWRGSHMMMTKPGWPATLSVPDHREMRAGTLRSLIRDAGLTIDEFLALLR